MVRKATRVDKRESQIKKKLSAAVIMLLVSCIMTVTSTYAWFTLSTAPEIKGVSTTVGANGSLEIALATGETWNNTSAITSEVGDSGDYTTWGNMIDLSGSEFGLSNITLYPAKLNTKTTQNEDGTSTYQVLGQILSVPLYGVDGRVKTLEGTINGTYNGQFFESNDDKGVRAIGRTTNMTARQSAYRNALDSILIHKSSATSTLKTAWVKNGGHLSSLAISVVSGATDNTTVTQDQYLAVGELITALETAVSYIDKSMASAVDGYLASAAMATTEAEEGKLDDDAYLIVHNELTSEGYKLVDNIECASTTACTFNYGNAETVSLSGDIASQLASLKSLDTTVKSARSSYPATATTISEMKNTLDVLIKVQEDTEAKTSTITVGGHTPTELKEFASNKVLGPIIDDLTVQFNEGSGVYYDIATFVGNYSANVEIPQNSTVSIPVGDSFFEVNLAGMTVVLKTNAKGSTKLDIIKSFVETQGVPSVGNAAEASVISDTYGYVLDFIVRTNASNSDLLLSTEALNRVGTTTTDGSEGSEETMGAGSKMLINQLADDLSINTLKGLLDCMRVVFMDESGIVLAQARFDTASNEDGENFDLRLWDSSKNDFAESNVITALPVNTPYKLSAVVYLDGETIDNADVSNAVNSFVGTLNLQFASSAQLVPMKYSDYQELAVEATVPQITKEGNTYTVSQLPASEMGKLKYAIVSADGELPSSGNDVVAGDPIVLTEGQVVVFWVEAGATNTKYKDSKPVYYAYEQIDVQG